MKDAKERARRFLGGDPLPFAEADALWRALQKADELSLARAVLSRLRRRPEALDDGLPSGRAARLELCRQEAMLTSKDSELSVASRHDRALETLREEIDLDPPGPDCDAESLGIAGGICKRRWEDLGQIEDLRRAAGLYGRGAEGPLGEDAYTQINAAFLEDLLAGLGDEAEARRGRADAARRRIVDELEPRDQWWNAASRAEAWLGLGRADRARDEIARLERARPDPWELKTAASQLATLAHLRYADPLADGDVRAFFDSLLPGAGEAVRSAFVGRVGLALSGGGFRAGFFHLGVLARLAELDVLRHVDVLSGVSGGSILAACYWLALRRRLLDPRPLDSSDYLELVAGLIAHFEDAVAKDLRGHIQPGPLAMASRLLRGERGLLDPERGAEFLERHFFRPLFPGDGPLFLDQLPFQPADHDAARLGGAVFDAARHNWLRAHKVPNLVINATTVNTGHCWQFTPRRMGESPWAMHEAADTVSRLHWSPYDGKGWRMALGRAVAASACVPGAFAPLGIRHRDLLVELVDGGVYDNQGTVSLLAQNCNVLIVSDAAGQLLLKRETPHRVRELPGFASRLMEIFMERIRQANFADLASRHQTGPLRGLMFLHMKAGLEQEPIYLGPPELAIDTAGARLPSATGIRQEFQEALASIRTDLDAFSPREARGLMACGYQMAVGEYPRSLARVPGLAAGGARHRWPFHDELAEITSTAASSPGRAPLLAALHPEA